MAALAALACATLLACNSECPPGTVSRGSRCHRETLDASVDAGGAGGIGSKSGAVQSADASLDATSDGSSKKAGAGGDSVPAQAKSAGMGGNSGTAATMPPASSQPSSSNPMTADSCETRAASSVADGCCPTDGNSLNDPDCSPKCGNGVLESGETCDPPATCDTDAKCRSNDACITTTLAGDASKCTASCETSEIMSCRSGDGCCPKGCNNGNDTDCSASCGDGVVSGTETCEPSSSTKPCPASCDDGDPCTKDLRTGTPEQCNVACTNMPITKAMNGDQCCPKGANAVSDSDCAAVCGNGVVESGEVCDGNCVSSCDDGDACTSDQLVGSKANCDAQCMQTDTSSGCVQIPAGWTLGTKVDDGQSCPSGFDGSSTTLKGELSTRCAATCSCSAATGGSCTGTFSVQLSDGSTSTAVDNGGGCIAPRANMGVTTIKASGLSFSGCTGGTCSNCNPQGSSVASTEWGSTTKFCAIGASVATCASGKKCPPAGRPLCLLSSGSKQCPAGFTESGSGWFTDARAGACACSGCGIASGQDCSGAKWAFGYGVCPAASIRNSGTSVDSFYTLSAAGGTGQYPTQVAVASELIGSIVGSPSAATCSKPMAVPTGDSTGTNEQTLCCSR